MPTVYRLHTTPKRAHTQLVERVCVPGPEVEGDTGSGVPKLAFATPWAASLSFENELQLQDRPTISLAKDTGAGGWERQTPLAPPPRVHKAARKLAFCFDQNARAVYAWQAAEAVYITQFSIADGEYITRGPFSGVDPTLYLDAFALGTFVDSDVILFYLKPNRTEVAYRIQRELYANEHDLVNLFDERIAEARYYMDQVIPLSYQYQIALWTKNFGKRYLLSNPYPVKLDSDNLGGRFAPGELHHYLGAQNAAIESILQGDFTPEVLSYFQVILSYVAEHEVQIKAQPDMLSYFVQLLAAVTETRLDIGAAPVALHHEKILDNYPYEHQLVGDFAPTLLDYLMIRAYDVLLENKVEVQFAPTVLSYFANLRAFDLGTETITAQFAPELVNYRDVTLFADKTHSMNVSAKPHDVNHYNVTIPKGVVTPLEINFIPSLMEYTQEVIGAINTVLLVESKNEPQWSTSFVDSSGNNHDLIRLSYLYHKEAYGSPPGLGSSAMNGGYLEPASDFPNVFLNDFTLECWVYRRGNISSALMGQRSDSSNNDPIHVLFSSFISIWYDGSYLSLSNNVKDVWQHVAVERDGNTLNLYVNGVLSTSKTVSTPTATNPRKISIGTAHNRSIFQGYFQQFRLSDGARYQGNDFTPPNTFFS